MVFITRPESSNSGFLRLSLRGEGTQEEFRRFVETYFRDHETEGAKLAHGLTIEDVLRPKGGGYIAIVEIPTPWGKGW